MTVEARPSAREIVVLDLLGLTVALLLIAWTFLVAHLTGGLAGPVAGLLLGCVLAYGVGRISGSVAPSLVPISVVVSASALALLSHGDVMSPNPLGGPFGYVNAKAAFFVQATFAALMLASVSKLAGARAVGFAAAAAFALVPIVSHSWTAAVQVLTLPILTLVIFRAKGARLAIVGCAALFILALLVTTTLGVSYRNSERSGLTGLLVRNTVSERRLELWSDAIHLMMSHPTTGVGPGRFQAVSRVARSDPDARWAHNELLQMGAETGVVGLLLTLTLLLWLFVRIWTEANASSWLAALGAGALAAIGIHACVDYVFHFPSVAIVAAALVGSATGTSRRHLRLWVPFI
jgi:O-antigen ligase